jgi:hypothetical protein
MSLIRAIFIKPYFNIFHVKHNIIWFTCNLRV